jgi:hypothetical protein
MKYEDFLAIAKPMERPLRVFHCGFSYLETWLEGEQEVNEFGIDLVPDFQRGHVWNGQQQAHYIENVLRRIVDEAGLTIRFNCPTWRETKCSGDLVEQVTCIDGLQRLTAIRKFIKGELKVFGLSFNELPMRLILRDLQLIIKMYDFQNKKDLLQFYLDINSGGTPHSDSEISRVKKMLDEVE